MNDNNNNRLLWIVIALAVIMVVVGLGTRLLVDKIADRAVQKLQKEYSPSPYGPGIDPDKLDAEKLRKNPTPAPLKATVNPGWNDDWENQRK
jgi:hypothetical protein